MTTPRPTKVLHFTECLESGVGQAISRWINQSASDDVQHYVLGRVRISDRTIDLDFAGEQTPSLLSLIKRYRKLLRTWNPDIIHVHSTKAGIIARVLSSKGATVAYSPHCYAFLMTNYPLIIRTVLRMLETLLSYRTDYIVAVSPYEAEKAKSISLKSCKVFIEPNIPNPSIGERSRTTSQPPTDVFQVRAVGRYCHQKNPEFMKRILNRLQSQGITYDFLWIGSPDDVDDVVELPISGWLPQSDVESNIQSASVLLHTATWEAAVPLVALDAIRLGTPVVMFKRPEYSRILSHGLFVTETEAVNLLVSLSSKASRDALCELQRQEIESYMEANAIGNLRGLYEKSI